MQPGLSQQPAKSAAFVGQRLHLAHTDAPIIPAVTFARSLRMSFRDAPEADFQRPAPSRHWGGAFRRSDPPIRANSKVDFYKPMIDRPYRLG